MADPGIGPEQRKWLSRIVSGGGEVVVKVEQVPAVYISLSDGHDVRIPIRMFESLMSRGMFERVDEGDLWAKYRMIVQDDI